MKISGDGVIPLLRSSRAGRYQLDRLRRWSVPLLLLNPRMIAEALEDGFERDQISWMPNPVDVEEFRPAAPAEPSALRAELGIPGNVPVAIYTGRLSREGIGRSAGRFRAGRLPSRSDAVLLLVGDGPLRPELESRARELKIASRVRFVGRVPLSEIPRWLRASDVFALASPNEGFSCSLVEADVLWIASGCE